MSEREFRELVGLLEGFEQRDRDAPALAPAAGKAKKK
jgi:hypothetical protein